jgi:hypothetical protein
MDTSKTLKPFIWPLAIVSMVASAYPGATTLRNITGTGYAGV